MKSGEKINIKDMTDSHLNNTINFLKKRIEDDKEMLKFAYSLPFTGEMACEELDSGIDEIYRQIDRRNDWILVFNKEKKRRGIK